MSNKESKKKSNEKKYEIIENLNKQLSIDFNYCTTRIQSESTKGGSTGTGFIFELYKNFPILVTNKHVIEGMDRTLFWLSKMNEDGSPDDSIRIPFLVENKYGYFKFHPDPEVDLCAMQIGSLLNASKNSNQQVYFRTFNETHIPSNEILENYFSPIQDVFMIGYPIGIWDEVNNKPIMRKGITATKYSFDFKGKREFVVDVACFPGSSGSPILSYEELILTNGESIKRLPEMFLLGILYGGPVHSISGEISVIDIPTAKVPISKSQIPTNLGYAIKLSTGQKN